MAKIRSKKEIYGSLFKRLLMIAFAILAFTVSIIILADEKIKSETSENIYHDLREVKHAKAALLLGTSKFLLDGRSNKFYQYRMEAAIKLYKAGIVDYIIVSGDNSSLSYNEPAMMRKSLIRYGVPSNKITSDYAGLRTFDSVIRAKEVFGQDSFIVVSQQFHIERALFVAKHHNINAVGFVAEFPDVQAGILTKMREKLARVRLILDIYVLGTKPKHLGNRINIEN